MNNRKTHKAKMIKIYKSRRFFLGLEKLWERVAFEAHKSLIKLTEHNMLGD